MNRTNSHIQNLKQTFVIALLSHVTVTFVYSGRAATAVIDELLLYFHLFPTVFIQQLFPFLSFPWYCRNGRKTHSTRNQQRGLTSIFQYIPVEVISYEISNCVTLKWCFHWLDNHFFQKPLWCREIWWPGKLRIKLLQMKHLWKTAQTLLKQN